MNAQDLPGPSGITTLNRRRLLQALAMLPFGASAAMAETLGQSTSGQRPDIDPLARYRLAATASAKEWARHLHLPSLQANPQTFAVSAGAEDGAFGAGALCGWSVRGDRPQFDIVTGVSIGALIAPFAFLGSAQDETLASVFIQHGASDIMRFTGTTLVNGSAIYDSTPLADLIASYTPPSLLADIARRHQQGGRLFVVTTQLETSQAVIWNMGELAQAGRYDLFRAVLRASSALPALFSPVSLRFDADGTSYRETHVDGGVQMQALVIPDAAFAARRNNGGGHLYLLINNTLDPAPQTVSRSAMGISQQALTAMVRASAGASVDTARQMAARQGLHFSFACVNPDADVVYDPSDRFSARYMQPLFQYGFARGQNDQLWQS